MIISWSSSLPQFTAFHPNLAFPPIFQRQWQINAVHLCSDSRFTINRSAIAIAEATQEDELYAAAKLRIRSFHTFHPSTHGIEDHKNYLAEREFDAIKLRISGSITAFRRVSCINATIPLTELSGFISIDDELLKQCKYEGGGEQRVVIGSLDLNQCLRLPDELTGKKPEGIGADFARAYLSNVCVAKEVQRNGVGKELIEKSKMVAGQWGISDLYVHVAVDNEAGRNLYTKSGFVYENDEPLWQARHLNRPRRILLWMGITCLV